MAQPPSQGHVCLMNAAACVTTSGVQGESVKSVSSFSKVRTHYSQKTRRAPAMPNRTFSFLRFFFFFSSVPKSFFGTTPTHCCEDHLGFVVENLTFSLWLRLFLSRLIEQTDLWEISSSLFVCFGCSFTNNLRNFFTKTPLQNVTLL